MPRWCPNVFRRGHAARAAALAAAALTAACGLFMDLTTDQCTGDGDCLALGRGLVCRASSCVAPLGAEAGATDAASPDAGADSGPKCQSNLECMNRPANNGEPYVCNRGSGACVKVKSERCNLVLPDRNPSDGVTYPAIRSDDVVLAAAFAPLDTDEGLNHPIVLAYRLALKELQNVGGLPNGLNVPRRPVSLVLCDSNAAHVREGVSHVVNDLHVSAAIALFSQSDMADIVPKTLAPAGVFTVNPQDTTEALKKENVNRLLWHLLGTPDDVAVMYRPLFTRVESLVNRRRTDHGTRPNINVALVTTDGPTELAIKSILRDATRGLVFNGKSVGENETATVPTFKLIPIPNLETPGTQLGDLNSAVTQLANFHPDVVILLTGDEAGYIVPKLDLELKAEGGASALPFYVLSLRNNQVPDLIKYINASPGHEYVNRFVGVNYASATDLTQKTTWLERMRDAYPTESPDKYRSFENYYDAVYWLGYGLAAAGPGAPIEGASFSKGVRKLIRPDAPKIHPGEVRDVSAALTTIGLSGEAQFVGTLGPLDIDEGTGAARSLGSAYCFVDGPPPDAGALPSVAAKYDLLRTTADGGLTGSLGDCILGF